MKRKTRRDSKTPAFCTCKWLERAADDPEMPIEWDARLNEFHLVHGARGRSHATLWFCPSCGGAAPRSKRALLFARIDDAETSRLRDLISAMKTEAQVVKAFGKPDRDLDDGVRSETPEKHGKPGRVETQRTLWYSGQSKVANILVCLTRNGRVASFAFVGKPVEDIPKRAGRRPRDAR